MGARETREGQGEIEKKEGEGVNKMEGGGVNKMSWIEGATE